MCEGKLSLLHGDFQNKKEVYKKMVTKNILINSLKNNTRDRLSYHHLNCFFYIFKCRGST